MQTLNFDFDNISGIARIYAIPADAVRAVTLNPQTGYHRITLQSADSVIVIPVYNSTSTTFDEQQETTEEGDQYTVTITVFIPRSVNPLISRQLQRGQWLVVHQDANGDILLSGTTDIPLNYATHRQNTPDTPTGDYGTFSAIEPAPSLHIDNRAFYL